MKQPSKTEKPYTISGVTHRFSPSFATQEFPWEANSDDDFICKIDEYTFRVEQIDKCHCGGVFIIKMMLSLKEQTNFQNLNIVLLAIVKACIWVTRF